MEGTRPQPATTGKNSSIPVLPQDTGIRGAAFSSTYYVAPGQRRKPVGYGLPCSKCHLYYPADLDHCPICDSKERVLPVVAAVALKIASPTVEAIPDTQTLEQEREAFLQQFKSQLFAAHSEVANAPAALCALSEHHSGGEPEKAEVCKQCYDRLQERIDVCEAALHIDLKEATQIIYDAVWADPSDPGKTYTNAANALLMELRKRGGISTLLGPFQALSH
jgi:hypothetical protein